MANLIPRARELLAVEYSRDGEKVFAARARTGRYDNGPDMRAIVAALAASAAPAARGWVVADGQGARWRMWGDSGPEWTTDRDQALHFARRADAEAFANDDEDAWLIQSVSEAECETVADVKAKLTPREWSILLAGVGDAFAARRSSGQEPVQAEWSKRDSSPTDWRNELLTLAEHHGPIPAFARSAMRVIARSMPGQADQAVSVPYSIDADPDGIRARVADAITGALMVGAQGHTPPPAGHWAEPFWKAARADAAAHEALIAEAVGCFDAADGEGWDEALAEGDIERIRDLWTRRISFAYRALIERNQVGG